MITKDISSSIYLPRSLSDFGTRDGLINWDMLSMIHPEKAKVLRDAIDADYDGIIFDGFVKNLFLQHLAQILGFMSEDAVLPKGNNSFGDAYISEWPNGIIWLGDNWVPFSFPLITY